MIQDVLQAIQTQLQGSSYLSSVKTYHLVDGFIPGVNPTISIGCGRLKYQDYDSSQDEVTAQVRIYFYVQDMKAERGEQTVRNISPEIRYTLLEDIELGGIVDTLTVTDITFDSDQVNQATVLHYAIVECDVKYREPRQRPVTDQPFVSEMDTTINSETINVQL